MAKKGRPRKAKTKTVGDDVNHPAHYNKGRIETVLVIDDMTQFYPGELAASLGHMLTYLGRAPHKGNMLKDLQKCQWWMNHLVEVATRRAVAGKL